MDSVLVTMMVLVSMLNGSEVPQCVHFGDGNPVCAQTQAEWTNIAIAHSWRANDWAGTCTLYEDLSLGGDCGLISLDPETGQYQYEIRELPGGGYEYVTQY